MPVNQLAIDILLYLFYVLPDSLFYFLDSKAESNYGQGSLELRDGLLSFINCLPKKNCTRDENHCSVLHYITLKYVMEYKIML